MSAEPTVRLKSHPRNPHPWIWRGRVEPVRVSRSLSPGAVVQVLGPDGTPFGRGLFHPHVTIALRLLTRDPDEQIDAAFFQRRFERALTLRRDLLRLPDVTDSYRLVHAEADELSGLVVDVLNTVVRVEVFSRGMSLLLDPIRAALSAVFPDKAIVCTGDRRTSEIEGFRVEPERNPPGELTVTEHGVRFRVDLRDGHKTGFFLDQRENRDFLARLCRGREVLDVNTYTGGFALHAAVRGEAKRVTGVDLDEKAIAVAKTNAKLNQVQSKVKFKQADAFPYLRDLIKKGDRPEVLILDPPKFARDAKEKEQGLRSYSDLNRLGLEAIADGGIFLTCSCSGVVTEQDLLDVLRSAAGKTGRALTILRTSGAAADHPVALHVPETGYLKAVFARVDSV